MQPAELGVLPPAEVAALIDRWTERERRADFRIATLCVLYGEAHRDRKRHRQPFHVADFFSSLEHLRPPPPTDADIARRMDAVAEVFT